MKSKSYDASVLYVCLACACLLPKHDLRQARHRKLQRGSARHNHTALCADVMTNMDYVRLLSDCFATAQR